MSVARFDELEEMAQGLSGVEADMWLPARPERNSWTLVKAMREGFSLMYGDMAGAFCAAAAVDPKSTLLVLKLDEGPSWTVHGHDFSEHDAALIAPRADYFVTTMGRSEWAVLRFDDAVLEERVAAVSGIWRRARHHPVSLLKPGKAGAASLRALVLAIARGAMSGVDPQSLIAAQEALARRVVGIVSRNRCGRTAPLRENAARIVARASRYLDEHASECVYIDELCVATACSERTLRRAFHSVYRMGPIAYLTARRLNLARAALASGTFSSVSATAMHYGFFDFGRFAAAYRGLFGESPSETRARASTMTVAAERRSF